MVQEVNKNHMIVQLYILSVMLLNHFASLFRTMSSYEQTALSRYTEGIGQFFTVHIPMMNQT